MDKQHPCGCVTFWHEWTKQPPSLYYRHACPMHRWYAVSLGLLAAVA